MISVYEWLRMWVVLLLCNIVLVYIVSRFFKDNIGRKLLYVIVLAGIGIFLFQEYCLPIVTINTYIMMTVELWVLMGIIVTCFQVLRNWKMLCYLFLLLMCVSAGFIGIVPVRTELFLNTAMVSVCFFFNIAADSVLLRINRNMNELERGSITTSVIVTLCVFVIYGVSSFIRLQENYFSCSILLFVIADAFLMVTGSVLSRFMKEMNKHNERLHYANERYEIDRVNRMYEEARKLRHNLKHCVITVKGMMKEQQYEKADEFLDKLVEEKIDAFAYARYCNNQVLNYMLNDKFEQCRKLGITYKCMVMGEIPDLDEVELSILLGNLLDNAIEASVKSRE